MEKGRSRFTVTALAYGPTKPRHKPFPRQPPTLPH